MLKNYSLKYQYNILLPVSHGKYAQHTLQWWTTHSGVGWTERGFFEGFEVKEDLVEAREDLVEDWIAVHFLTIPMFVSLGGNSIH